MGGLLSEKFLDTNLSIPFAGPPLNTPSLQKYKRVQSPSIYYWLISYFVTVKDLLIDSNFGLISKLLKGWDFGLKIKLLIGTVHSMWKSKFETRFK